MLFLKEDKRMSHEIKRLQGGGRNSNIELLRVTAMSLIILHHMMVHGLNPGVHSILYANLSSTIYPVLEIGVNLFFMISGYFGVKLSLQSILKLAFIIFLFTIVNYLICLPFNIYPTLEDIFLNVLFPISKANYWFISVYLRIIMVSPLINMGLNGLDRNKLRSFIVVFTFLRSTLVDLLIIPVPHQAIHSYRGCICTVWLIIFIANKEL